MSEPEGRKRQRGRFWWIDRWRKSSAFIEMTLAQQGAYHNLLDEQRLRGGLIPNEDRLLSRACGDPLEWPDMKEKMMRWFEVTPDGKHIFNRTANEVNDASDAISTAASAGGKAKAAAVRLRKGLPKVCDPPAEPPAEVAAESLLPLTVVRKPLSVSGTGSESGEDNERSLSLDPESAPPTTATPAEATALALSKLGPPEVYRRDGIDYRAGDRLPDGRLVESVDDGVPVLVRPPMSVDEAARKEYADAVWTEFLRVSGERATRLASPGEYATLRAWLEAGIPLRIVLRGIGDCVGKGRTLGYYGPAVTEAHESWRQAVPL